jgi:translation initiation factor eIF-2B subunit delta
VIVVDSSPEFPGRNQVQRLARVGIRCKYTLLNGIGALITKATLVFVSANCVFGNGGIVSQAGTAMVSYMAKHHRVPVVSFCESYKFSMRVNIDQMTG